MERGVSFADTGAVGVCEETGKKTAVAAEILAGLPEWFGLPESTKEYIEGCRSLPFWRCQSKGRTVGFLALKETSPYTAEIFVMGVCREFHGAGAGRALVLAAEQYALGQSYEFLQVKTVQKGHYAQNMTAPTRFMSGWVFGSLSASRRCGMRGIRVRFM